MRRYPKLWLYLGYLNLAVWRCYISFLSRWCGSDVLLYGGLHTYPLMYVVDPFACRLRRPYRPDEMEVVGTAERSTREWLLGPHRTISTTTAHPGLYLGA